MTKYEAPHQKIPESEVEEKYDKQNEKIKRKKCWFHDMHVFLGNHDHSKINGRPHHITPWIAGLISGIGNRRR
ncbi:hypothetical protein A2363_03310 [Candidatus Gottesmanbacteria bacterium RIFOXYB1_FULL_47_11]|uniref:Uncharacterized protein n=1 Tax=Candidatus Gottesmanbacteria bacterium RIFOXYB1_FULL_47_11 TaxID=1798401 RepID=A0A1F6BE14_9BACT|nr:MAG: hypothetical protein A2363_03310 [Candidatus Gottesmanbacteria bacterium RIFOXYB1_FULL_47_11]